MIVVSTVPRVTPVGNPQRLLVRNVVMTNTPIEMTVSRPRAVVTGAAQGIGAAICERLRSDGFEVTGLDLHPGEAGDSARSCDITDKMAVEALAAELGPVGVLVNNAGIWRFAPLLEAKSEDVRAVLEVNLIGTLNCIQAFGRRMSWLQCRSASEPARSAPATLERQQHVQ